MWKSSSALIGPKGLLSCPNAGLSSARLLGSIAAEGSPMIGRTAIEKRLRSCTSPQFGSCLENFVIRPKVSGQTLRYWRAVWWYVLGGHRAHLSCMAKLRFDDTDYSVVVKNRRVPPKSWRWEIY